MQLVKLQLMQYGHITFQDKVKNNGLVQKQMTNDTYTNLPCGQMKQGWVHVKTRHIICNCVV